MTRRGWRSGQARWLGCGAVSCMIMCNPRQRAQAQPATPLTEADRQSETQLPLVEVVAVGGRATLQRAKRLLPDGAIGSFRIAWQSAGSFDPERFLDESDSNVVARCFLDFTHLPEVRLYFADRTAQRFLLRSATLSNPSSEIDREVMSQIVELSLQAVLQPDSVGLTREETRSLLAQPPEAAPSPAVHPAPVALIPRRTWGVRAGAFYWLAAHSDEVRFVTGPGLAFALVRTTPAQVMALELRGKYQLAAQYRGPQVGLEFSELSLEIQAEWLWLLLPGHPTSLSIGPKVGAGMEFSYLTPLAGTDNSSVAPTPSRISRTSVVNAGLLARWPLSAHFGLWAELSATVDPALVEYDLILPTTAEPVVERYRIRTGGLVGLQSSW